MSESQDATAACVGRGLLAGLVGTVAMTVASPGDATTRTKEVAHWGLGAALGAVRGLLGATGLGRNAADVAFHGAVRGAEGMASDLAHPTVYALATNGAYRWLSR